MNAMTHGYRAEKFALPDEAEIVAAMTRDWIDAYQPDTPGRIALMDRAILAHVQLLRGAKAELGNLSQQILEAVPGWVQAQEDEVDRIADEIHTNPRNSVFVLKRTALGCRWLIDHWKVLLEALVQDRSFRAPSQLEWALRLLGCDPDDPKHEVGVHDPAGQPLRHARSRRGDAGADAGAGAGSRHALE